MLSEREVWLTLFAAFARRHASNYHLDAESADRAIREYEKRWGFASAAPEPEAVVPFVSLEKQHEAMWHGVVALARKVPYCMGSERGGHREAAGVVFTAFGLAENRRPEWQRFVDKKTATMSTFAGD